MKASCVSKGGVLCVSVHMCSVSGDFPNQMERVASVRLFPGVDK